MAGHRAFEVAIDMAQRQRDATRRLLVQQRGQCANAQAHLDQLTGYAQETRQRWGANEGARLLPEVLRHQLQFLQRLEQTAQMQQTVVQAQQRRVQQAVQQLAAAEARLASLRHVLQQRERAAQLAQQRREQKETDEWAMQRHVRGTGRQLTQGI